MNNYSNIRQINLNSGNVINNKSINNNKKGGKISTGKYEYEILQKKINMKIPEAFLIRDERKIHHFKKKTFGGYAKSDVSGALTKSIKEENLEQACHWAMQLLLSGSIHSLWDKLLTWTCKNINIANPRLPAFICNRYITQMNVSMSKTYQGQNALLLRNIQSCRNYLTEFLCIIILSRKNKIKTLPKIKTEDFNVNVFKSKLKAPNTILIDRVIKPDDPSEITIVANEFANYIHYNNTNVEKGLYWLSWMLEWEKLNKQRYGKFECGYRSRDDIQGCFHRDLVWMIWELILNETSSRNNNNLFYQINHLWKMYLHKFTAGSRNRKLNLILWSIYLLTHTIDWKVSVCDRMYMVIQATANINLMIAELKKNELKSNVYKNAKFNIMTRDNYMLPNNYTNLEEERHNIQKQNKIRLMEKQRRKLKNKHIHQSKINSINKMKKVMEIDSFIYKKYDQLDIKKTVLQEKIKNSYNNQRDYQRTVEATKKQIPINTIIKNKKTNKQVNNNVIQEIEQIIDKNKPTWEDYGF